ncbi:MAG: ATP-binding cassette domain-containing protein [Desulfomicrobium sp.]|nr:ATP-binding cassette domain-containing protein [Pseudomonadota bacterium]MBV1713656.1 ATP-binding cassette domain-containing protein [Desulfomicrobium sp.]MBU4572192.1 ATP-binding cassette domain-containing protein [Pseudomonadota bacterium]MBU4594170.1 ATP-binding cassette domain-containing protein [Pseudomonadota bacterium]MBV1720879.1 ATP-binding cassette domain-containing protein [Desulfomicrobium sp.]
MALISASNISLSFSGPLLLDGISLQIHAGERTCLLGRNGEGKSTLMRILSREIVPDSGEVGHSKGISVGSLPQEVPADLAGTVYDVVASGAGEAGLCLAALRREGQGDACVDPALLARAHRMLDEQAGWSLTRKIDTVVTHLGLDPEAQFASLSGGVKRKTLLARALAGEPDVLFLDEPTNHLDVDSIRWLEEFLVKQSRTLFFVTHDRMFLRHVANRILELDRGVLVDWACDYDTFLQRKEDVLATEETLWRKFDQKLKEEEIWIRKGVKARRTRNEGRVRALKAMRAERRQRRERTGAVSMLIQEAGKSGRLVLEVTNISYAWGDAPVIRDFSANIMRGDKVGIVGPNGVGKTTLLKLLLGDLEPQNGTVRQGTHLEVAYSDQMRTLLDETKTAREIVGEGSDYIDVNENRRHVIGYLKDFLFTPDRAQTPVNLLSGGERNRLLLAKLFTRPCNVLVLDEPTNDLDQETLELLEELIGDFPGTVLVVSHDREFLNNTVTSCLVFEGQGRVVEYAGGYDDWLLQRPQIEEPEPVQSRAAKLKVAKARKLTYKENLELDALPERIEALEADIAALHEQMNDPEFYSNDHTVVAAAAARLEVLETELDSLLTRWDELEELRMLCESS